MTMEDYGNFLAEVRQKIRADIVAKPFEGVDPTKCDSQADIAHMAVKRLNDAIHDKRTGERGEDITLDGRKKVEQEAGSREPTNQNIVAFTYALHATALKKGEFMYRGSFSIEDRNGEIARWLDKADDLYVRDFASWENDSDDM